MRESCVHAISVIDFSAKCIKKKRRGKTRAVNDMEVNDVALPLCVMQSVLFLATRRHDSDLN